MLYKIKESLIRSVKILFFVALSTSAWSQIPAEEEIDYIYRSHWYLGPKLSTNGYGLEFNYEKRVNENFRHGFHVSLNHVKNHKESRKTNSFYDDSKSYIFGKINQLYTGHLSYGISKKLFEKKRSSGVSIRFNQQIGISCGLIKPIYLKIKEPFVQDLSIKPTDERYDPSIHAEEYIYGRSSVFKGLSDSKVKLGMYIKSGIQFDINPNKSKITAVELGFQLDAFSRRVPEYYIGKNKNVFPSLYAVVQFGKNKI